MFPDVRINDAPVASANFAPLAGYGGVGAGLAYYLPSVNVFIAGTLLASRITVHTEGAGRQADGVSFEGLIGKEFWISDNWGLGPMPVT
jgi:hypothetical protein